MNNLDKGVIAWFVQNPVAANLLMMIILILGISSAQNLQIQGFPSIEANTITIDTIYNSGNAKQSQEGVTIKIEEALQGIEGIREIRSSSSGNGSTITIEKDSDYSLAILNEEITNKVNAIYGLPITAEKPIITKQKNEEHAIWFDVYGNVKQSILQETARKFKQALLRLPSVTKVNETGWKKPEISIEINESKLQALNLSLNDVAQVIASESFNETSGQLRSKDGLTLLKADKQRYSEAEFSNVIVKTLPSGSTIMLSDIAEIKDSFEESPNVLSRYQGMPAINYQIIVGDGANVLQVAEQAKQLAQKWENQGKLPKGVDIAKLWDQSSFMKERLWLLAKNGVTGIVLVMLTLAIFLNVKVAFWVGLGLPVCFAGALILMGESFFSLTINELTTFGFIIVLGILVDDAIVVGESVYSTKSQEGNSIQSTVKGVKRIAVPTMFGVLTTVAAFYPMSFIAGDLGKIFSQFALVAVGCLIFSLIESKLILPSHLANVTSNKSPNKNNAFCKLQEKASDLILVLNSKIYQPTVNLALRYRYVTVCAFLSIFILVIGLIPSGKVGFVFFPDIPRNIIEVNYKAEPGSGYQVAHNQAYEIEDKIEKLNSDWHSANPTNKKLFKNLQVQVTDDISGSAIFEVTLPDNSELSNKDIENLLRETLVPVAGIREFSIQTDSISIDSFSIKLLSDSKENLESANNKIISFLKKSEGTSDIQSDLVTGTYQIEFELNAFGRSLGLTSADLSRQISHAFYGAEVQRVQRGKDEVKVFVRYPASQRKDTTNLQDARIRTDKGLVIPLSDIANTSRNLTQTDINHVNGQLAATISAKIDKTITSPDAVMTLLQDTVLQELALSDVDYMVAGESAEQEETMSSMKNVFALSLFLIYLLTAIPLKSYIQPFVIMLAIPFGVLGAILGHWYIGIPISILSLLGVIALSGVVVNNSLLIVSRYNELLMEGKSINEAILTASSQRLRAILLTSITTFAGLASLLQETSEQAAYLIPAAASLAYGILFSTTITLVLVPAMLVILEDINNLMRGAISNSPLKWLGKAINQGN